VRFTNYLVGNNTAVAPPRTAATAAAPARAPRATSRRASKQYNKRTPQKNGIGPAPPEFNDVWGNIDEPSAAAAADHFFGDALVRRFLNAIGIDYAETTDIVFKMVSPTFAAINDARTGERIGFHFTTDNGLINELAAVGDTGVIELIQTLNPLLERAYTFPNRSLHIRTMHLS
jgi:hypothetical protein